MSLKNSNKKMVSNDSDSDSDESDAESVASSVASNASSVKSKKSDKKTSSKPTLKKVKVVKENAFESILDSIEKIDEELKELINKTRNLEIERSKLYSKIDKEFKKKVLKVKKESSNKMVGINMKKEVPEKFLKSKVVNLKKGELASRVDLSKEILSYAKEHCEKEYVKNEDSKKGITCYTMDKNLAKLFNRKEGEKMSILKVQSLIKEVFEESKVE